MQLLVAGLSGFIAFSIVAFMPMVSMFMGGAASRSHHEKLATTVFWCGMLLSLLVAVVHIWGQIKYWGHAESYTSWGPVLMMFSGIPICIVFFGTVVAIFKMQDNKRD